MAGAGFCSHCGNPVNQTAGQEPAARQDSFSAPGSPNTPDPFNAANSFSAQDSFGAQDPFAWAGTPPTARPAPPARRKSGLGARLKGKAAKLVLIILAAVIVVAGAGFAASRFAGREFAQLLGGKSYGRNFVVKSLTGTASSAGSVSDILAQMRSYETSMSVAVDAPPGYIADRVSELSGEEIPDEAAQLLELLSASTIQYSISTDADERLIGVDAAWRVKKTDVVSVSSIIAEDELYLTLPQLFEETIGIELDIDSVSDFFDAFFSEDVKNTPSFDEMLEDVVNAAVDSLAFKVESNVSVDINGKTAKLDAVTAELTEEDLYACAIAALEVIRDNDDYIDALAELSGITGMMTATYGYSVDGADVEDVLDELLDELDDAMEYADDDNEVTVKFFVNSANELAGLFMGNEEQEAELGFAAKLGTGFELWYVDGTDNEFRLYGDLSASGSGAVYIDYFDDNGDEISGKLFEFSGLSKNGVTLTMEFSDLAALDVSSDSYYSLAGSLEEFLDSEAFEFLEDASIVIKTETSGKKTTMNITFNLDRDAKITVAVESGPRDAKLTIPKGVESYDDVYDFISDFDPSGLEDALEDIGDELDSLGYDVDDILETLGYMIGYSGLYNY
ncbi:MAG: hypothetical protein LBT12_00015 [Oscillospiraceae bacterium]|nr:hypothetical protein [Oscillospiraceae bacterium]